MRNAFIRNKLLILHVSFWILYYTYRIYDIQHYVGMYKAFMYTTVPMVFYIVGSYIHYFFILPAWIKDKRNMVYIFKLSLLLCPLIFAKTLAENHFFTPLSDDTGYYQSISLTRIISSIWNTLSFILFTGMIRFTITWFDLESKKNQLENEKLVAELNYLKAQINPHFLFNTLHNLNYLVYAGSSKATEVIIKLSNIMRYMIYDANKDLVSLKKEIAYMKDYIDLERIRLNHPFKVDFNIKEHGENVQIAPLIMLTFLENAFKHGVSDQQENCWIEVNLNVTQRRIQYEVRNSKLKIPSKTLRSGFGLSNVKKRLALSYPERHELTIHDTENEYHVLLTLEL